MHQWVSFNNLKTPNQLFWSYASARFFKNIFLLLPTKVLVCLFRNWAEWWPQSFSWVNKVILLPNVWNIMVSFLLASLQNSSLHKCRKCYTSILPYIVTHRPRVPCLVKLNVNLTLTSKRRFSFSVTSQNDLSTAYNNSK